jgi:hypothetical protein
MNFLHYSIVMFVACSAVLFGVSMFYPAPVRSKIAGLTFATIDEKLDTVSVKSMHLQRETRTEHAINVTFTCVLLATVFSLWIYFR